MRRFHDCDRQEDRQDVRSVQSRSPFNANSAVPQTKGDQFLMPLDGSDHIARHQRVMLDKIYNLTLAMKGVRAPIFEAPMPIPLT